MSTYVDVNTTERRECPERGRRTVRITTELFHDVTNSAIFTIEDAQPENPGRIDYLWKPSDGNTGTLISSITFKDNMTTHENDNMLTAYTRAQGALDGTGATAAKCASDLNLAHGLPQVRIGYRGGHPVLFAFEGHTLQSLWATEQNLFHHFTTDGTVKQANEERMNVALTEYRAGVSS